MSFDVLCEYHIVTSSGSTSIECAHVFSLFRYADVVPAESSISGMPQTPATDPKSVVSKTSEESNSQAGARPVTRTGVPTTARKKAPKQLPLDTILKGPQRE